MPGGFTVGSMKFDNANRYTIAGPGTITISATSTGVGAIEVVSGSHTISAPMNITSNTTIDVGPASSTLTTQRQRERRHRCVDQDRRRRGA